MAPADDPGDGVEHGRIGLVEELRAHFRVAINAQHELGEVVATDRHPLDAMAAYSGIQ